MSGITPGFCYDPLGTLAFWFCLENLSGQIDGSVEGAGYLLGVLDLV
jgi:hypothetical protein